MAPASEWVSAEQESGSLCLADKPEHNDSLTHTHIHTNTGTHTHTHTHAHTHTLA